MFEVQVRHVQEQMILDLSGPLGREGGEAILRAVREQPSVPHQLIFNFSRVGQMNTAGIGGVLWVVRQVTRQRGLGREALGIGAPGLRTRVGVGQLNPDTLVTASGLVGRLGTLSDLERLRRMKGNMSRLRSELAAILRW